MKGSNSIAPGLLRTGSVRIQPVANSKPSVSGAMPAVKARMPRDLRRASPKREAARASVADGSRLPVSVAATPASPAMFHPTTATNSTFGPGAAWAMATEAVNCASLSQPCSPTT